MIMIRLVKISIAILATGWLSIAFAQNDLSGQRLNLANQDADSSTNTSADSAITTKIKSKFINEKLFGSADVSAMTIKVETNNGVVHLTGSADNQEQIENAAKISNSVNGVTKVINDVTIKNK